MINFRNTIFIKSASSYKDVPSDFLKDILFVGRSNVGKSSLINSLCDNSKLAFVSSKPGFTKLLNYFNVDKKFYLVDAPGYGYSKSCSQEIDFFANLMEDYFNFNSSLRGVIFLLDSRHEPNKDDVLIFNFLKQNDVPFVIVLTKADKINQSEKYRISNNIKKMFEIEPYQTIFVSTKNKFGIDKLRKTIENLIIDG